MSSGHLLEDLVFLDQLDVPVVQVCTLLLEGLAPFLKAVNWWGWGQRSY